MLDHRVSSSVRRKLLFDSQVLEQTWRIRNSLDHLKGVEHTCA